MFEVPQNGLRLRSSRRFSARPRRPLGVRALGAFLRFVLVLLAISGPLSSASGQNVVDLRREYNVKAVSLYGFGRYVTWPKEAFASQRSPFVIGVLGPYPFGSSLDQIAQKKTIHNRRIEIARFATIEEYHPCHILFVARAVDSSTEAKILQAIGGQYVLLVGETPGFAERGGMINFVVTQGGVRFELNVETTLQQKLTLNAKLHSLGTRVRSR